MSSQGKFYFALMWHQHQPVYKDTSFQAPKASYIHPWVRLHSIRDYYSMAAIAAEHPKMHLTINLTPSLLWQIEDYLHNGATDRTLELSMKNAEKLSSDEKEDLLSNFFDADWHNQIFPHPRYKELFVQRRERRSFSIEDLRDLQMWFNLAWFGKEFRDQDIRLVTGELVSVRRYVEKGRGFSQSEIEVMVDEQFKIMRAIVPIHKALQDQGQIEISTTPFFHPILPLLVDSSRASLDRFGTTLPRRFAYPEDAEAHVQSAVRFYERLFGQPPYGMWPAEGAVSQFIIPIFTKYGLHWIATDRGVLARSGRWGYDASNPDVLCRPYGAEENGSAITVFFRDTQLSDAIGFRYQGYQDHQQAAQDFLHEIKERFVWRSRKNDDRILTVVLDGENAWGAYQNDARPFLHALYSLLENDSELQTVTFREYILGDTAREVSSHPIQQQERVYELFTGSWIDENASAPGVDLGTWIGEEEENKAWELLLDTRDLLKVLGVTPLSSPDAFQALYMAEGSDWFWWFGDDQDSGTDDEFDDLFRIHLKNVYRSIETDPLPALDRHIVPHTILWTFTNLVREIEARDRLTVRTNCPGILEWKVDEAEFRKIQMQPVGGVMAGSTRYFLTLGPFLETTREVRFRFRCTCHGCDCSNICCSPDEHVVQVSSHFNTSKDGGE